MAILSVAALTGAIIGPQVAQAALNKTAFELDKDAQNDIHYGHLGVLNANFAATDTSIVVCQDVSGSPATPFKILVDAERMNVVSVAAGHGGGCTGTFKRVYTVSPIATNRG
ncbi:MAG TPA: hypothetical protein VKK30_01185, partial [Actinomycetota bacterium]|nr:hypothetical protein [Actinomycetota bacterium]